LTDLISLTGLVATTPRHITTSEGLAITSFRLASSQRRYDRAAQRWVDGDTNWYTVSAFRGLAQNSATSLGKGDRVIVSGRVRIRDWENTDRSGTTVEIEAESLGHDLTWGTAVYTRTTTTVTADDTTWVPDTGDVGEGMLDAAATAEVTAA
jgi:single-strand DNA-binding protein